MLSALAAVYTEWALKRNSDSLYWQNMQLYSWGFLCNAVGLTINDLRQGACRCQDAKAMAAAQMCLRTEADNILISPCGRRWARSVVYPHVGRLQLGHLPGGPEPGLQRPAGLLDHEARRLHRQGVHSSVARLRAQSLDAAVARPKDAAHQLMQKSHDGGQVYATSMAMLLTTAASVPLFGLSPSLQLYLGIFTASVSLALYYLPPSVLLATQPSPLRAAVHKDAAGSRMSLLPRTEQQARQS